jgi:hypothetical protein
MSGGIQFERKRTMALKGLDGEVREMEIAHGPRLQRFRFARGDKVFGQGDPGELAFVVETGLISIVQRRILMPQLQADRVEPGRVQLTEETERDEVEIAQVGPGAIFGELALIDGLPRTATAVALRDSTCVAVSATQLDVHLQDASPDLAQRIKILLAFVRAVPARAAWPGGVCPDIPAADLAAVHSAVRAGENTGKIDPGTPFLRAIYQTLCAYALARFP